MSNVTSKLFALVFRYWKRFSQSHYSQLVRGYFKSSGGTFIFSPSPSQCDGGLDCHLFSVSPGWTIPLNGALYDACSVAYYNENSVFTFSFPVNPSSDVHLLTIKTAIQDVLDRCKRHGHHLSPLLLSHKPKYLLTSSYSFLWCLRWETGLSTDGLC
jgi:hypothetical protein